MAIERHSALKLIELINQMNKDHNESEIFIPGKGLFKISINEEANDDLSLAKMIENSRKAYKEQEYLTTSELLLKVKEKGIITDE